MLSSHQNIPIRVKILLANTLNQLSKYVPLLFDVYQHAEQQLYNSLLQGDEQRRAYQSLLEMVTVYQQLLENYSIFLRRGTILLLSTASVQSGDASEVELIKVMILCTIQLFSLRLTPTTFFRRFVENKSKSERYDKHSHQRYSGPTARAKEECSPPPTLLGYY